MNYKFFNLLTIFIFLTLSLYPQNNKKVEADLALALQAYQNDDYFKALFYANKVLKVDKNNVKALYVRSKILLFKKDYKASLIDINNALEQIEKSNDIEIKKFKISFLRDRGVIYDYQGNYENALKDFLEVLELSKIYPTTNNEKAMINFDIAIAYYYLKDFDNCEKYLEVAIDYNPFKLSYYELGINIAKILNKNSKKLDYYYERGNLIYKYSEILNKKILDNITTMPEDTYQKIDGIEKYYDLIFTKNGDLLDPQLLPIIKINDIYEIKIFADEFSEFMGNYMISKKTFSNDKVKILGLKIVTFYEDIIYNDLHFIYKVKLEIIKDN